MNRKKTAGIILGHFYSGFNITGRQKKRLGKGIELFRKGDIRFLITTGGKGMFKKSSKSNADLAKNYLIRNGMPEERVLVEDKSVNTYQNALYSLEVLKSNQLDSAIVITSSNHTDRAERIFRKVFPEEMELRFTISDRFAGFWNLFDFAWKWVGCIRQYFKENY
jgi:uncharacterized SAM-binding protein YcdF (DUF218 family)